MRSLLVLVISMLVVPCLAQGLTLVEGGKSAYVIYREAAAPPSVKLAAEELQRVIEASTGAKLRIVEQPAKPMISLGDNPSCRSIALEPEKLPDDSFRWVIQSGNLYIVGKDLPDDKPLQRGWTSYGTLYGTYHFLELNLGVRWLMPGDVGEEIPPHDALIIDETTVGVTPDFPLRYLVDIQDRRPPGDKSPNAPLQWETRQKLPTPTFGRKLDHGHAWDQYLKPDDWRAHPEWMALDENGKRRDFTARPAGVKYCTTNPELVKAFAAGVIKWLDEHPAWRGASISPADGGDFCKCPECQKLVRPDPHGNPSYSLNILKFYNDVAKIVAAKHPNRPLAGYVYYNYMYPPTEPVKMEPNVWLVMAGLNYYGFGLYKPVYKTEFPGVVEGWLKLTPNFIYHNYGTWMRSFNGAPLPTARAILKLEIPTVAKYGGQGVDMVGLGAWGVGAPTNYLYAKLMWDAKTDVDKTYEEWLRLAYGPGYDPMRKMLDLIEDRFRAYKAAEDPRYRGHMYEMNYEKVEAIYLPIFPEMERLYSEALGKVQTDKQKQRLEMFGKNLIMLHWGMRKAGMNLPDAEKSCFYRSDEDYQKFLADTDFDLSLYRDHGKRYVVPVWKGEWSG